MSLKKLRQLQKELAKAISTHEDLHKAETLAKLEAIAKKMGYSLAELIGVEVKVTCASPHTVTPKAPLSPGLFEGEYRSGLWGTSCGQNQR